MWDSPLRSKEATAIKAVPERIEAATQEPARGTDPFGSDGWARLKRVEKTLFNDAN